MKRRHLLKQTALVGASGLMSVGAHGWAWRAAAAAPVSTPRLIVIFLRGAADGLNIVVPYQELDYYEARPTLAIAPPGQPEGALDLDGQFGLHPALQPLMAEWTAGRLAFVHACGSPDASRSHFQAQDYMEAGTPEGAIASRGWLNRLLSQLETETDATANSMASSTVNSTRAVSIGDRMPLIFTGPEAVASLAVSGAGNRALAIDRPQIQTAFDRLYTGKTPLALAYQEGRSAREVLLRDINEEMMAASRGAPAPAQFATSARYLARLMAGDSATQVAFMELGDWDTHVNEGTILNRNLAALGTGLQTLIQELGPIYETTSIVVLSEFGRTVAENGNNGTDHGHGNVMWLLGGGIKGKQVYGEWPGLAPAALHESRDLAITTDFREVLTSLLQQQFGLGTEALAQVFPGYQAQGTIQLL
jgi:uncharacterized protein (DUF1501 family)